MLETGTVTCGFTVLRDEDLPEIDGRAYVLRHEASGARLLYLRNDDENKSFSISFKTPPADDTGVFHILEHSVLCGSRAFPVKEPFVNLLKTSMQTFLNALTFPDKTMYPVASTNEQDLLNLMDVYLDAVLHPAIYADRHIFEQEGWHYELADDGSLTYNGVVFNEMKGALSDPESVLYHAVNRALFPGTPYEFESGGTPRAIPTLTYEQFLDTHARHYNLANSYLVLYGNLDLARVLAFLDERYLGPGAQDAAAGVAAGEPNPFGAAAPARTSTSVEMDTAPENACVGIGYVVGESGDFERVLAADVLCDALMGGNESPLKRAVLDADLGGDCTAYLMDAQAQPTVMFVLRGAHPGAAEQFQQLVEREAARLAREGIPRDVLEASLSQMAFDLRERDRGVADGVALAMNAMSGWLYDDDAATRYLHYEGPLAALRAGLEGRYFEDLLASLLPENPHAALVDLLAADTGAAAEEEAELAERAAALTAEESQAIRDDVAALRARQEAPDAPEDLAKLPQLRVADIGPAQAEPACTLDRAGDVPYLRHDVPTRGISYWYGYFPLAPVAFEDLPYVELLALLLGNLDTRDHTAAELDSFQRRHLGTLRFFVDMHVNCEDAADVRPTFTVSAAALDEEAAYLASIPREIWETTRFDDAERVRDRLVQHRIAMEQGFMSGGHASAMSRVGAGLFPSGVASEQLKGVGFYRFLCDLLDHYDERADALAAKLEEVRAALFRGAGFTASFTGGDEACAAYWEAAGDLGLCGLGEEAPRVLEIPAPRALREAFVVPGDVVYVACGANLGTAGPESGVWSVASSALSLDYLWNEVRVKGGAYGCGFRRSPMGFGRFYSYRDPRLDDTLARFARAGEWLASFDPAPEEMEGYIVSTVAGHDAPVKPRALARRQDAAFFAGRASGWRAAVREQMLSATPEQVRAFAPAVTLAGDGEPVCVFGSAAVIDASEIAFDVREVLLGE